MKNKLSETNVALAVQEILEDRNAEVIKHCQDMTTKDGKPCKITIEVVVTPNKARNQFSYVVSGKASLSPRYGAESTLYAAVADGEVEVTEYNPEQEKMPFGKI